MANVQALPAMRELQTALAVALDGIMDADERKAARNHEVTRIAFKYRNHPNAGGVSCRVEFIRQNTGLHVNVRSTHMGAFMDCTLAVANTFTGVPAFTGDIRSLTIEASVMRGTADITVERLDKGTKTTNTRPLHLREVRS